MIFIRPGQGHDQPARHLVRNAMHVVDLRGQQQLADVGEDRFRHPRPAGVLNAIDRRRHAAGKEAFYQLDQLGHAVSQMGDGIHIETVGLGHERTGTDQQVSETSARADAAVSVVVGVGRHQMLGVVMLTRKEHLIPGHQHLIKMAHGSALAIFGTEMRCRLTGPARRPRNNRQPLGINGYRTADRKVGILLAHGSAWHYQQLVHVGATRHNGFHA